MGIETHHILPEAEIVDLDGYVARGGGRGLEAALQLGPAATLDEIEAAGLRGRGGAGFPTHVKWRGLARSLSEEGGDARTRRRDAYVVVNAAEGEPGTFKDRALLRANPFAVVEGLLVALHTLQVTRGVIAAKASYRREIDAVTRAVQEMASAGWADGVELRIVEGPDHYLFGEETALLEVIEGEDPLPRHLPPYQYGLFTTTPQLGWSAGAADNSPSGAAPTSSNPALVNNTETFAHVAAILANGASWYRSLGTPGSPGPTIVTITGDVRRAAVAEITLGARLGDVIDALSGGTRPGRSVKAVLSGVANRALTAAGLDSPVSYEGLAATGGGLGSAGFIVYDDRRNMVDVAYGASMFLHVESCGQCTACKTGTHDITAMLEQLVHATASGDELDRIAARLRTVTDANRCFLPVQARALVGSILQAFPADVAVRLGGSPGDPDLGVPKLVDIVDGVATVDPRQRTKRPDWTYAPDGTPVRIGL